MARACSHVLKIATAAPHGVEKHTDRQTQTALMLDGPFARNVIWPCGYDWEGDDPAEDSL